jgi:hypothetical protein
MLETSNPSIDSTPITPFLEEHAFRSESIVSYCGVHHKTSMSLISLQTNLTHSELAISLDGSRARKMLGFKPAHPTIQVDELKAIVQGFQRDGLWCVLFQPQADSLCCVVCSQLTDRPKLT